MPLPLCACFQVKEKTVPLTDNLSNDKGFFINGVGKVASVLRSLLPLLIIILFSVALWTLHRSLKGYNYHQIMSTLEALPAHRLFLSLGLCILSYLLLTAYDSLALHYIRHPIAYARTALASFISYAFSQNISLPLASGVPVRYHLYSGWGLSAAEIGKVVIFNALTFNLGFLTVAGTIFLFRPVGIPPSLHLPFFTSVRPLGVVSLGLVAGYLVLGVLRKKPIKILGWEFGIPAPTLSLIQITISSLGWIASAGVLYVLLPPAAALSFLTFFGIYLLAQIAGMISQVPGGFGVFEAIVLLLLSPYFPVSTIMGSLLAFRGIYYLCPLGVAAALLGSHEALERKRQIARIAHFFGHWVPELVPHVFAFTAFLGGAILLFSGATPAARPRLIWLSHFLPLPLMELSHFFASLVGAGLILLSRGLQRRLDAAYVLATTLLSAGILFSLLKGFAYKEATILAIMLAALLPCRRHFYRKASLISQRFTPGWITAIILVLWSSIWLGLFSYKHIEYSNQLWWQFALSGDAPRFLRATVGSISVVLFFMLYRLMQPGRHEPAPASTADLDLVRAIVSESPKSSANLALLGDKIFLFSQSRKAFIMYGVEGRSWVALGDPVGPEKEHVDLVWQFREMCDCYGGWTVFYEVKNLHLYLDLGLIPLKLGEEARVLVENFSLEGSSYKWFRYILRRFERDGFTFEFITQQEVSIRLAELKEVSDTWLKKKDTREKRFSLGFFNPDYLKLFPAGIVSKGGKVVAFANVWLAAGMEELSVDLMRYLPDAPDGIMDYLFIQLILWGKQQGYKWFNLGMAPLSGLESRALAPFWNRLGSFVFRHGEHFYNFQGLRRYKEKFNPVWEPKYLASPGGLALPRILTNLASLISGGIKGVVTK